MPFIIHTCFRNKLSLHFVLKEKSFVLTSVIFVHDIASLHSAQFTTNIFEKIHMRFFHIHLIVRIYHNVISISLNHWKVTRLFKIIRWWWCCRICAWVAWRLVKNVFISYHKKMCTALTLYNPFGHKWWMQ